MGNTKRQEAREEGNDGRTGRARRKSQPLPIPLLLKYDISETAGAPKEVKKKWKPVGSQGRGDADRRHRGPGRVKWGRASPEEIKTTQSLLIAQGGLTFGTLWELGEGGVRGGVPESKEPTLSELCCPPPPTPPHCQGQCSVSPHWLFSEGSSSLPHGHLCASPFSGPTFLHCPSIRYSRPCPSFSQALGASPLFARNEDI